MESDYVESLDKLLKGKNLVKGLFDTMVFMEMAEQDKMIPMTVFGPFETALEKIYLLLEEAEAIIVRREREKAEGYSQRAMRTG